ncbi:MAG: methionine ABC transporter substrate-binding lipoprotein MetQ [Polyangiales bacterium]
MRCKPALSMLLAALALSASAACGKSEKKVKIGVISGAEEQVAEVAVKLAKERFGAEVELVVFSDYVNPNAALADGSLDANAFQHRPFLDQQVKDRGYKLAVVGNTFVYPIAAYSKKIKKLSELKDGAEIAVPNDPTNLGRALVLLEKQGLLKLKPGVGAKATSLDIAENPRKLKVVELEAPQLPRALPDVDLAVINTNYATQIDLSPTRDGLFHEEKDSPYVNLIVSREDNKGRKEILDFVKAYQTDEVYAKARELFQEGVVKGW